MLKPSRIVPMTLQSFLAGPVSTTPMAAHTSHKDMTLFYDLGVHMLISMSFTNPRSAGILGGTSRWLSMSSTACIADAPVGMCMLEIVSARWPSTCIASLPLPSMHARQTWSIMFYKSRSSVLISHLSLSLLYAPISTRRGKIRDAGLT